MATCNCCIAKSHCHSKANYLNLDYSMSSREKVTFSKFSQANLTTGKKNEDGVVEQVLESLHWDSDANSPTYLQELKNYNPV